MRLTAAAILTGIIFAIFTVNGNPQWDFSQGTMNKWKPVNFKTVKLVKGGGIQGISAKYPHLYSPELKLPADKFQILEITLKTGNSRGVIYFKKSGKPFAEARKLRYIIPSGQGFKTINIDCTKCPNWQGIITGLRLDFGIHPNNHITVKRIRFKQASSGILRNDNFTNRYFDKHLILDDWQVTPKKAIFLENGKSGIVLAPNGKMKSSKTELLKVTPQRWDLGKNKNENLKVSFYFKDIFNKLISSTTVSSPKASSGILNIPSKTAYIETCIENTGTTPATVLKLVLTPVESIKDNWQAFWLWNKNAGSKANSCVYFYKNFNIKDINEVDIANLQLTADDWQNVYLNGTQLTGPNHSSWQGTDIFSIKTLLKNGNNTLAIKVINAGGPGGVLAELAILKKNGQLTNYGTNSSWKCFYGKLPTNQWWQYEKLAIKLQNPQIIGKANESLWGKIPFHPIKRMTVKINNLKLPKKFTGENEYLIKPTFTLLKKAPGNYEKKLTVKLELHKDGQATINLGEINIPVIGSKTANIVRPFKLNLKHIPAGKYKLKISSKQAAVKTDESCWIADSVHGVKKEITLLHNRKFKPAKAELVNNATVPMFKINDKELVSPTHFLARMTSSDWNYQLIKNCTANGIKGIWLHYDNWQYRPDGGYDFNKLDTMCSTILAQAPKAHIVVCIYLDSVGNMNMRPWNKKYPEELVRNDKGEPSVRNYSEAPEKSPSMASKVWLKEGDAILKALIEHIRKQPYGERVVGIVPSSGISWEWMYWGSQKGDFADYSKPFQNAFRQWAKEKYTNNLQRLNSTWHKQFNSFDEVTIPNRAERIKDDFFDLRRPKKAQYQIDFQEFLSQVVANAVCHFSRTVKKVSNNDLLSGSYYGYVNFLLWGSLSHNTGHFALTQVLNSPDVDLLMAPSRYSDRELGGASGFMSPEASIRLHRKLCINEADIRTQNANNKLAKVYTLTGAKAVLEREMASVLVSGGTLRWFDFSKGWIAGDKRLVQVIENLTRVEKEVAKLKIPTLDSKNSVAVISSEVATYYSSFKNSINHELVQRLYPQLFRSGAGFDFFLLSDLEKMPKYKCYIFTNAFKLTAKQRKYINEKLKNDDRTLMFFYAADIIGKDSVNIKAMNKLLEMQFEMQPKKLQQKITLNSNGVKFFNNAETKTYISKRPYGPVFYPISGMLSLGTLNNGKTGLALKQKRNYRILYSAVPAMPTELLREIIKSSKLPVYNSNNDDITWAAGSLFAIHSKSGGKRIFTLPIKNGIVKELINQKEYKVTDGKLYYNLPPKSTVIFHYTNTK